MSASTESHFSISIPDSQLELLQRKLSLVVFPDELEDAGTAYGAPLSDIKRLVSYWQNGYDWPTHEAALNAELPQFTRDIPVDGFGSLNIHYVHKRSAVEHAIPLLFVHGWPGCFFEVRKILPLLVDAPQECPSFHVVALSLPGFGFSTAPTKKGFALNQYAEVAHKLMLALGYDQYAPPSHKRPLLLISHLLSYLPFLGYTEREKAGLARSLDFLMTGSGYFAIQSTRPQTLSYGITDSPVGLLAWIYEKLAASVEDGKPFTDDEILTWISIYYFSRAGPAASFRIYYEVTKLEGLGALATQESTTIPLGHSYFPNEAISLPRSWYKVPNLIFESEQPSGGHFAAIEEPEALVADLRAMFGKAGPAFGVIEGKSGFT
ncbi:hypothetical protein C0989_012221 [Termitomyces sp. Mn162]|nr:hypothetical protein C0989_012221 [Termitomyces sp. Mn162]